MAKIKITKGELKSLIKEAMALDKGLLTESKSKKIQTHPLYGIIKEELTKVKMMNSTKSTKAKPVAKQTKTGHVAKKTQATTKKPLKENQMVDEGFRDVVNWVKKGALVTLAVLGGGIATMAQDMSIKVPSADTVKVYGYNPKTIQITPYAGNSIQVSTRTKFTGQASEKTDNIVATMLQPKVVETPKTGSSDTTNTGVGNSATSKGGNSSVSLIKPTEKFKKFATWLKGSEGGQGANIENTADQYMRILAPKGTNFIFYDAQGNEFDSGTVQ